MGSNDGIAAPRLFCLELARHPRSVSEKYGWRGKGSMIERQPMGMGAMDEQDLS